MTEHNAPLRSNIWTFKTRSGTVRLNIGVRDEDREVLYSELRGCAVVAEDAGEFLSLSSRAVANHHAIIADILEQAPIEPLPAAIRRIAANIDPFKAADQLVLLIEESPERGRRLLTDPELSAARAYISDLLVGLDEHGDRLGERIATLLEITPADLANALQDPETALDLWD